MDALAVAQRQRIRRDDARTALLRWTMACLWSSNAPEFEAFLPPDPDQPDTAPPADAMTMKITAAMAKLGAKTIAPPTVRAYSEAELEFIQRVNSKLLGDQP